MTTTGTTCHGAYVQTHDAATGRIATLRYPSSLKLRYQYDAVLGYLTGIVDFGTPTTRYYGVDARDAEMHLVQSTAGNGVVAIRNFDPRTGLVRQIRASADGFDDGSTAHTDYAFDSHGTLMSRSDMLAEGGAFTEHFCYDGLNRLTSAAVGGADCRSARAGAVVQTASYDDLGNITAKSDVGTYVYGGAHPHAVMQISGSVLGNTNPKYSYDANGNLTCVFVGGICGADTSIRESAVWTAANRIRQIKQGTFTLSFDYDSEHQRSVQHQADGSALTDTVYLNDPMGEALSERVVTAGTVTWNDYLVADGRIVAERVKTGATAVWNHFVPDHLGSIAVITGEAGAVLARQSYDPWGRMRNPDASPDTACTLPDTSQSTRGFTGQEQMPRVCLVNLNARLYDPTIGRFLSPDSVTQDLYDLQVLNRYSYCANNPLSFTDPSGNIFETVVVTAPAYINPALAVPAAVVTMLAELGFGGALGAETPAVPPSPPANVAPQSPIQASGNQTGIPQMQNTAVPQTNLNSFVSTSDVAAGADATQTQTASYTGATAPTDSAQTIETVVVNGQRLPFTFSPEKLAFAGAPVSAGGQTASTWAHHYHYRPKVCDFSDQACTRQSVWDGLKHNAYPGQDPATTVENGGHYYVMDSPKTGAINVAVDDQTMTITNYTDPSHIFCCGSVVQHVAIGQDGIYLDITGTGTNTNFLTWGMNYAGGNVFPYYMAPRLSYFVDYSFFLRTGAWPMGSQFLAPTEWAPGSL